MSKRIPAVLLMTASVASGAFAQTIPELARAKPASPVVRGALRDVTPASFDELMKGAELVVEAKLQLVGSFLNKNEDYIYTDYKILPIRIFSSAPSVSNKATPGPGAPLILSVYGGELTIDGVTVKAVDYNVAMPRNGASFLLFLRPYGEKYQYYRGAAFEIDQGQLKPLLKQPYDGYKDISASTLDQVVLKIQAAARK
jgi:hypothetical protein